MFYRLIIGLIFCFNSHAVSEKFIQGAGVALQGGMAASVVGFKMKSCCTASGGTGATCCIMAVSAGMSALSLFSNASDAHSNRDQFNCSTSFDQMFCDGQIPGGDYTNGGINNDQSALAEYQPDNPGARNGGGKIKTPFGYITPGEFKRLTALGKQRAQAGLDSLAEKGAKMNPDGSMSLPDGRTLPAGALASTASMRSAGLSDGEITEIIEIGKKAKDLMKEDLRKYGFGYGGGAGGAFKKTRNAKTQQGPDYNKLLDQFMNKDKKPKRGVAAAAGGLSKNLTNGEKIGVASDNLFHMVHRKYQQKTSQRTFMP